MNWKKILVNVGASAGAAFLGTYQVTGKVSAAGSAALAAVIANLFGLGQKQPVTEPKAE